MGQTTIQYLNDYDEIFLSNRRGDSFNVATGDIKTAQKLVIYVATDLLPKNKRKIKYHKSKAAGIIHVLSSENYMKIIKTLITPSEVFEYLEFRERLIQNHGVMVNTVSEESMLGQYIVNDFKACPNEKFHNNLINLKTKYETWDILNIIHLFPKRVTHSASKTDYYYILREIARLMRNDLKLFKERFILSMDSSKANKPDLPYRFANPDLDLGFVFIPLCKDQTLNRKKGLINLTSDFSRVASAPDR